MKSNRVDQIICVLGNEIRRELIGGREGGRGGREGGDRDK